MQPESQIIGLKKQKLQKIINFGVNPFPNRSKRTYKINVLRENQDEFIKLPQKVFICGRLDAMRRQGRIGFGNVSDDSGRIQIFVKKDVVGEDNYEIFKLLDLGDFVQIEGECFITQKGEYSVRQIKSRFSAKTCVPSQL